MAATRQTDATIHDTTAQLQELGERVVEASKKVATQYLDATERTTQSLVSLQRQVAQQTDVEWIASIADAQARFTADVSKILISSGRELLK
jgi:hypothetical protein